MSRRSLTPVTLTMATIAATLLLSGCAGSVSGEPSAFTPGSTTPAKVGRAHGPVALLVPLTGPYATIGQSIEKAVKLAFSAPNAPPLDVRDTGGTPQEAVAAARAAIESGDGLILGPLTKNDTHAVAGTARDAGVNVLAFTNDDTASAPGVWPLGISPDQQVHRVVSYAIEHGRTRTAAILPENQFGRLMGAALQRTATRLGTPPPQIGFYTHSFESLNQTTRSISDFNSRGAGLQAQIRAARAQDDAAGRRLAAKLRRQPVPPPPFNSLLIGATGEDLAELQNFLPYYEAGPPQVQLLGPALWAHDAKVMATHNTLRGALYAAPDPAHGIAFEQKFQATYGGNTPPAIDKVAFDAAAIAVLAAREGGYTTNVLTNPSGFTGTDGVLRLEPDGRVARGLAVFKIEPGGPKIVSPAPQVLPASAGAPTS